MRLLIYLLAMMTGFSAAEAARPVATTPAALGSAIEQRVVAAVAVAKAEQQSASIARHSLPSLAAVSIAPEHAMLAITAASPVSQQDVSRQ